MDAFLEGNLMSEDERRETAGKLRAKIMKKFGKRQVEGGGEGGIEIK